MDCVKQVLTGLFSYDGYDGETHTEKGDDEHDEGNNDHMEHVECSGERMARKWMLNQAPVHLHQDN